MTEPNTAEELMEVIEKWLHKDPASEWGEFEIDLYDILIDNNYYGIDGDCFND